jgi:hypothetical protein
MHISFRRRVPLIVLLVGAVVVVASGGLTSATSATSAATSGSETGVVVAADVPVLTTCNGPRVNADRTVTFCLTAPQATSVQLNFQDMVGRPLQPTPSP